MQLQHSKNSIENSQYYFDNIDIIRGFAAISVVVYHVIEHFNWTSFPVSWPWLWFRFGWMGVDIFFVISGFVIAMSAFKQIEKSSSDNFFLSFMKRRVNRILPLHYLTLIIFIAFISPELIFGNFFINLLAHLLFIHNWSFELHGAINGSNWSLGVEMQFYILIALTAAWLKRVKWWVLLLSFLSITYVWRLLAVLLVSLDQPLGVYKLFVVATQLPGMLDEFAAGILLAKFIKSDIGQKIIFGNNIWVYYLIGAALVSTFGTMYLYLNFGSFWDYTLMVVFFRTLLALSVSLIILAMCAIKVAPIIKLTLFPLYYLGTISYGVYLWHLPIILSVKRLNWLPQETSLTLVLVLTLILASLSWYFFEKQFLNKIVK